jgi:hypothetical protein
VSIGLLGIPATVINFDKATPGTMPPGWSCMTNQGAASKWEILKDLTAPTPPYVFAQVSNDTSNWRFPVAILDQPVLQNGEISVRMKPVAGKEDQAGGIVWRFRDPNDYYVVRANALENNLAVYRVEGGHWKPLLSKGPHPAGGMVRHPVPANTWSILKVTFKGPVFSVYFNHRRLLQVEDRGYQGAGKVGLWTKSDSVTYFDDFRVAQK